MALASPDDVAARIAWMLASGADQKQLEEAMQASSSPEALSPLGELLLYEWLTIRVGKLLTLAPPRVAPSEDALLESVNKRVSALFEDQRSRK